MRNHYSIKSLFLTDAVGASASTLFLGVLLVYFQPYVGMPVTILYVLAGIAACFMAYSWSCYFVSKWHTTTALKAIAVLNLGYSLLTLGLVIYHFNQLTLLGITYFLGEIIILWFLVSLEMRARSTN